MVRQAVEMVAVVSRGQNRGRKLVGIREIRGMRGVLSLLASLRAAVFFTA